MPDPHDSTHVRLEDLKHRARQRFLVRRAGLVVGIILTILAAWFVARDPESVRGGLETLRRPSPLLLAGLAAGIALNMALTGSVFSILMSRRGRVGLLEMQALIAGSTLINYLPLRPGLLGRAAYHKLVNGIAVRDTAMVVVLAILLSAVATVFAVFSIGAARLWAISAAIPLASFALASLVAVARPRWRVMSAALFVRIADVFVWAARYVLAFGLLGIEIDLNTALALAAISMASSMVPFLSNGLGLREWVVGWAAPLMVIGVESQEALLVELVHRGIEVGVVLALGLIGTVALASRRREAGVTPAHPDPLS